MQIVNCTAHDVVLLERGTNKVIKTWQPSGFQPRCEQSTKTLRIEMCDGVEIPVTQTTYGDVIGLPPREAGTMYIVSAIVAKAMLRNHYDSNFVIPNELQRRPDGSIIGCYSLGLVD